MQKRGMKTGSGESEGGMKRDGRTQRVYMQTQLELSVVNKRDKEDEMRCM